MILRPVGDLAVRNIKAAKTRERLKMVFNGKQKNNKVNLTC
jgi:hypothetical protein